MTETDWMKVLEESVQKVSYDGIVNDCPEKREILSLLNGVITSYVKIGRLLKSSRKDSKVFESRIVYGAIQKDISSAIYHANRQKRWVITEQEGV